MARKQRPTGASVEKRWWQQTWLTSPNEYDREIADKALENLPREKKKRREDKDRT